jgi:hypothetical protein
MDYRGQAARIARAYGLDPNLFGRVIGAESNWNPEAVSPAGAIGLGQLMPATAAELGVDPRDPIQNMEGSARYLRQMLDRFGGDERLALAAYNAGPGRVEEYGGVPPFPETQNYLSRIFGGGQDGPAVFASTSGMRPQAGEPQGLLGALGIQRRDPEAGGETAQPFYQRDTFRDFMGNLAIGLNELRLNPSETIPAVVTRNQERRRETARANQTMEWLRTQPGSEPYVQMLEAGGSPAEVIAAYTEAQRAEAAAMREAAGQLGLSDEQLSAAGAFRDDLRAELQNLGWNDVSNGFQNIMTFYESPSSVSDYALAVAFAKILDPGSVAREGEVAAVQRSGALLPAFRQSVLNALSGEGSLTPEMRQQIAERARDIYSQKSAEVSGIINNYTTRAEAINVPGEFIYFGQMPQEVGPVIPQELPTMPVGATYEDGAGVERPMTADVWRRVWEAMTDTQRQQFSETGQLPEMSI